MRRSFQIPSASRDPWITSIAMEVLPSVIIGEYGYWWSLSMRILSLRALGVRVLPLGALGVRVLPLWSHRRSPPKGILPKEALMHMNFIWTSYCQAFECSHPKSPGRTSRIQIEFQIDFPLWIFIVLSAIVEWHWIQMTGIWSDQFRQLKLCWHLRCV